MNDTAYKSLFTILPATKYEFAGSLSSGNIFKNLDRHLQLHKTEHFSTISQLKDIVDLKTEIHKHHNRKKLDKKPPASSVNPRKYFLSCFMPVENHAKQQIRGSIAVE